MKDNAEKLIDLSDVTKKQYEYLLNFIYGLNDRHFRVSPDQYINAEKILLRLAADGLVHDFSRVRPFLAPIFTTTPEEKEKFNRAFEYWLLNPPQNQAEENAAENENADQPPINLFDTETKKAPQTNNEIWKLRFQKFIKYVKQPWITISLIIVIFGILAFYVAPPVSEFVKNLNATPTPTPASITPTPTPPPISEQPLKAQTFYNFYFLLLLALIAFPPLVWMIWLIWWKWWSRQIKKEIDKNKKYLDFKRPHADKNGGELYESREIKKFAQELRRHRQLPGTFLDTQATVNASVMRAGFLTPVYSQRRISPEYLILIDRREFPDQQADLIDEWIKKLKSAGVFVDQFYFDENPSFCQAAADNLHSPKQIINFPKLASPYSEHRLLIFGEPKSFIEPSSKRPSKVLKSIVENWKVKLLLSTAPSLNYAELIVKKAGLPTLRFDENDLNLLLKTVQDAESDADETSKSGVNDFDEAIPDNYPQILTVDEWQWLDEVEPDAEILELLKFELKDYLDADGYRLLAACAVYPETLWDITFYLAHHLIESGKREEKLALLVRLPWFRHSKMPDWFRSMLHDDLPDQEQKRLRELIEQLLIDYLKHPATGFGLKLEQKNPAEKSLSEKFDDLYWRRFLYDLIKIENDSSVLRETVFTDFLAQQKFSVRYTKRLKKYLDEKKNKADSFRRYFYNALIFFRNLLYKNGNPLGKFSQRSLLIIPALISILTFGCLTDLTVPDKFADNPNIAVNPLFSSLVESLFPKSTKNIPDPSPTPTPETEIPPSNQNSTADSNTDLNNMATNMKSNSNIKLSNTNSPVTVDTRKELIARIDQGPVLPPTYCLSEKEAEGLTFSGVLIFYDANPEGDIRDTKELVYADLKGRSFSSDLVSEIKGRLQLELANRTMNKMYDFSRLCVQVMTSNTNQFTVALTGIIKIVDDSDGNNSDDDETPTPAPTVSDSPISEITVTPTPTPTPTPIPPLTVDSMTITYITGKNRKDKDMAVKTLLVINSRQIGTIADGTGKGEIWDSNNPHSAEITFNSSIPYDLCRGMEVRVNKTGKDQWDVSFSVNAKLSNGQLIELLPRTPISKLGDNDNYEWAIRKFAPYCMQLSEK